MSNLPASGAAPRLLDQVREIIRIQHYSIRTEQAYAQWIRRFILYHGKRHPKDMSAAEVSAFLSSLAITAKVSASTQKQALNAVLFLYRDVKSTRGVGRHGLVDGSADLRRRPEIDGMLAGSRKGF
jgi:hypothetical protein